MIAPAVHDKYVVRLATYCSPVVRKTANATGHIVITGKTNAQKNAKRARSAGDFAVRMLSAMIGANAPVISANADAKIQSCAVAGVAPPTRGAIHAAYTKQPISVAHPTPKRMVSEAVAGGSPILECMDQAVLKDIVPLQTEPFPPRGLVAQKPLPYFHRYSYWR